MGSTSKIWKIFAQNVKSYPHIIGGTDVSDGRINNTMNPTIVTVEERFRKMSIDGHPIEFSKYP